ncbi:hypothetical protein RJ639_038254 [Escallonia herrerae]|uniref:RNase H type-1 domain-containing protein n=1 Tax=Escallonia herrerae TaxID=1293975 RepID=A0AA88WM40_9ASTE|nr:hypothetical protein RJ639_038254 [Escallonia herrerae]
MLERPDKMRSAPSKRDKNLWCRYHNDHSHTTDNCESLKRAIEALIKRGQLRSYVNRRDEMMEATPLARQEEAQENTGVINTISGGITAGGSSGQGRKAYTREVLTTMGPLAKKQKVEPAPTISFYNEDVGDIKAPHDDPLVITLRVGNFNMKRILVNNGSSAKCYMVSCRNRANETLMIEDLRDETKAERGKPAEDLMDIELYPGNQEKIVKIGTEVSDPWLLYVDGSSKVGSSGAGLILISPKFKIEYALHFDFQASNNEAEYEALLAGIRLAHSLRVDSLSVHSDSQLVVNHILGEYEVRDERMAQYLQAVKSETAKFKNFVIRHIPRDQNAQADSLSRLTTTDISVFSQAGYIEFLKKRSIQPLKEINVVEHEHCWMDPIVQYLTSGTLPQERSEARNLVLELLGLLSWKGCSTPGVV